MKNVLSTCTLLLNAFKKGIDRPFSKLLFALLVGSFSLESAQAQYYHQKIDLQGQKYSSLESAKMITEIPGTLEALSVGTIEECPTCTETDIVLTLFDPAGNVTWSKRYGSNGTSEVASAMIMGYNHDRVIIVGSRDNYVTDALIMAIEIPSGGVIWTQSIGDYSVSDGFEYLTTVVNVDPSSDQYIALGTAHNSFSHDDIYSVGFDDAGNINWAKRIAPVNFDVHLNPINLVATAASGGPTSVYTIGTCAYGTSSNYHKNIFAAEIDPNNGDISSITTLEVTDNAGTYGLSLAGDMCYDAGEQRLVTTFNTDGIFSIPGVKSFMTCTSLDLSLQPTNGKGKVYYSLMRGLSQEHHYGVGIYEDGGNYDVVVRFGSEVQNQWYNNVAFLELAPSGTILSQTAYYNVYDKYFETGMYQALDGYYIKTRSNNDGYDMLGVSFSGSTGTNCDWEPIFESEIVNINPTTYDMNNSQLGSNFSVPMPSDEVHGINYDCSGGSQSFKREITHVEMETTDQASIYPTLVNNNDRIWINTGNSDDTRVNVTVTNTVGQVIFSSENSILKEGQFSFPASELSEGINLVTVTQPNGSLLMSSKIMKSR